jgi:antitoxin component YwqK of YwqJK toxin-antitoxin module
MKRIITCFFLLIAGLNSYSQVKSIFLNRSDQITQDSTTAISYAVFGKLEGDSVYTFKKFDFNGVMLTSGTFKDDSLQVPHGNFVYYDWITPNNNTTNQGYEINGKERFISLTGKFLDGMRTGRWISYYTDGKLKQVVTYYKGIIHGPYQLFDTDGKIQIQGLYVAGKKNGTWIMKGGKQEDEYVNDRLISSLSGKKLRDKQAQSKNMN